MRGTSRQKSVLAFQILSLTALLIVGICYWESRGKKGEPVVFQPVSEACNGAVEKPAFRGESHVQKFCDQLAEEAREIDRREESLDVVFYGDSIAETWRGTDMGQECERCRGGPEVFDKYFRSRYKAHIFAVGGDQTAHLQWRLLHGELLQHRPPRVAVLMIGTNDLGADVPCFGNNVTLAVKAVNKLYARIDAIIKFLGEHTPSTKIVLVGLPPRAVYNQSKRQWEDPNPFSAPVEAVNHIFRKLGIQSHVVHYVACGDELLQDGKVDMNLQGDGLHLTPQGSAVMASCILSTLQGILGPGSVKQPSLLSGPKLTSMYLAAKDSRAYLG